MGREYAAFISYSSRYSEWAACLRRNLELALESHGETRKVFLDQTDLGVSQSWVTQLQAGFGEADHLVLIVTPTTLGSTGTPWRSFSALFSEHGTNASFLPYPKGSRYPIRRRA